MKFRNQAWLCSAIYHFEARNMLSLCLIFHGNESTGIVSQNKVTSFCNMIADRVCP